MMMNEGRKLSVMVYTANDLVTAVQFGNVSLLHAALVQQPNLINNWFMRNDEKDEKLPFARHQFDLLTYSCLFPYPETVQYLIEKYKFPLNSTKYGYLPIFVAAACGCFQVVDILIKNSADVNAKLPECHQAPLHRLAYQKDGFEMLKYLVEKHGANIEVKDKKGETPILATLFYRNSPSIDSFMYLLQAGANPNVVKYETGNTLLHEAIECRALSIVKLLVEKYKFNIEAKNKEG